MIIRLRDIPHEGLDIHKRIAGEEIGLEQSDARLGSALDINAFLEKADDAVLVSAEVSAKYGFNCGRCLEDFEQVRNDKFNLIIEVDEDTESINLGDEIRQELIIIVSSVLNCGDDVNGKPSCGKALSFAGDSEIDTSLGHRIKIH